MRSRKGLASRHVGVHRGGAQGSCNRHASAGPAARRRPRPGLEPPAGVGADFRCAVARLTAALGVVRSGRHGDGAERPSQVRDRPAARQAVRRERLPCELVAALRTGDAVYLVPAEVVVVEALAGGKVGPVPLEPAERAVEALAEVGAGWHRPSRAGG